MSAVADTRGLKRICTECGSRFYDFNKRPITCPSCNEEFTGEPKIKSRRGRVAADDAPVKEAKKKAVDKENEEEEGEIEADENVVSLEDVDESDGNNSTVDGDDDELDLDDNPDADLGAGIESLDDDDDDDLSADIDIKQSHED